MNVDDIIADSLEFFLDVLCLGIVVVVEGYSKHLIHIKPLGTPKGVDLPWSIIVHMKHFLADIEIILPTVCSSQDVTNLHLHILGGSFRTGNSEKRNIGLFFLLLKILT